MELTTSVVVPQSAIHEPLEIGCRVELYSHHQAAIRDQSPASAFLHEFIRWGLVRSADDDLRLDRLLVARWSQLILLACNS